MSVQITFEPNRHDSSDIKPQPVPISRIFCLGKKCIYSKIRKVSSEGLYTLGWVCISRF